MAKYIGPVCRFCRREGEKLFLKGERCYTSKCSVERREGGPGQHGQSRGRQRQQFSDFKIQLRQKQKVKRTYGVLEKKFRSYYEAAARTKGVTGTAMLVNLERRLDNIVYRLGFASSRSQARQFVGHGLVLVNGKCINISSYQATPGDLVEIREKSKKNLAIQSSMAAAQSRMVPEWLALDKDSVKGTVNALPTRDQLSQTIKEQLIVELYSR